jgi:hypothetical protein
MKLSISIESQQRILISTLVAWGIAMNIALPVFATMYKENRQYTTYQRVDQFEVLAGKDTNWKLYTDLSSKKSEYYFNGKIQWRYNAKTGIRLKYECDSNYLCQVTTNENGTDIVTEETTLDPAQINEPVSLETEIR